MKKNQTKYANEFKKQIVMLYNNGKSASEICNDYSICRASLYKWVKRYNETQSFSEKDNRTDKEKELIKLRKELKQLRMENDILKQAALIMGQKSK